jgi:flagellar biosynthesis/type III secretory pathway protein FliH
MNIKPFTFQTIGSSSKSKKKAPVKIVRDNKEFILLGGKSINAEPEEFTKSQLVKREKESFDQGFQKGFEEGEAKSKNEQYALEQESINLANNMIVKLETLIAQFKKDLDQTKKNCIELASFIAKKVAHNSLDQDPTDNIAKAFESAFSLFYKEPEVVIAVNPKILENVKTKVENILKTKEFKGILNFVSDAGIEISDCKISWKNAGVEIKTAEMWQKVDEIISEYFKTIK